uniref:Peptidyl-prolyl cis-trans isomerase n=1 Tax=Arion vulgaris TaxID=1028688 RepID=A0A0B6ZFL5_9EUPU
MSATLACLLATLLTIVSCEKNYTITSEVVFELEVKNYNGNGDSISGKLVVGLFGESVPVASLNFKTLCEGFKRPNQASLSYRNTCCHRIVRDMLLQCGDVFGQEGYGSTSIYGESFNDENFEISHRSGGIVSMANKGKDTNGSQFFLTFGSTRFFDKKHVAFGKVVRGYRYLAAINRMGSVERSQKPKRPVCFTDCNVQEVDKYQLSEKDLKTDDLEGIVSY